MKMFSFWIQKIKILLPLKSRRSLRSQDLTQSLPEEFLIIDYQRYLIILLEKYLHWARGSKVAAILGSCSVFCLYKPRHFPSKVNTGLQMRNLQHKQTKWHVQGHVASWWQGLEEKPVGLTHSSSDIPVIISLLLLSWLIYSIVSNQICSYLLIVRGSKALFFGCPIMERKMCLSPPPHFLPSVSPSITQKYWLFFIFGCRMKKAQSDRQEQWMASLHSTTKVPVRLLDYPTPSQPCQQSKQCRYSFVWLLLKMQKRGGVAWDIGYLRYPLQILGLLSLEKSMQCSWACSFRVSSPIFQETHWCPHLCMTLEAVCPSCAAVLPPSVTGSSPCYPSVESVVHSDPYHLVITVVKVSINRISSCPSLLASSAVLFLTEKHVDAKQK